MIGPKYFLDLMAGHVRSTNTGAAYKANRLARIDPDYSSGYPQIIFEGETELTAKGYPYAAHYMPTADDRVFVMPVGTSYFILGSVVGA